MNASEPDFIGASRIAILGLGLMGGSLALALRGRVEALYGYDTDLTTLELARSRGIVDAESTDLGEILPLADVLVLAAPVYAILDLITSLPTLHPGAPIVLDLGSTKVEICQALEKLPERFDPIGGHPMCGKELAGLMHAEAAIFSGSTFAFTPLRRTSERARRFAQQLAHALGMKTVWLDPVTHDRWVAVTSHLPYLLAHALSLATPAEAAPLIGPGFQSSTRLAGGWAPMMLDVLISNRAHLLEAVGRFHRQLDVLEELLERGDADQLSQALKRGADQRNVLMEASKL